MFVWENTKFQRVGRETDMLFEMQDTRYDQREEQEVLVWKATDLQRVREDVRSVLREVQDRRDD